VVFVCLEAFKETSKAIKLFIEKWYSATIWHNNWSLLLFFILLGKKKKPQNHLNGLGYGFVGFFKG
jgi:hypothetical protein